MILNIGDSARSRWRPWAFDVATFACNQWRKCNTPVDPMEEDEHEEEEEAVSPMSLLSHFNQHFTFSDSRATSKLQRQRQVRCRRRCPNFLLVLFSALVFLLASIQNAIRRRTCEAQATPTDTSYSLFFSVLFLLFSKFYILFLTNYLNQWY